VKTDVRPAAGTTSHKEKIPKAEIIAKINVQPVADTTVVEKIKQSPLVSVVPAKPPIISKHKITRPETSTSIPPRVPLRPGEKNSHSSGRKTKEKGKAPVEVFIEEEKAVPHRKILEKKNRKEAEKAG